jgi:hypothetical protein
MRATGSSAQLAFAALGLLASCAGKHVNLPALPAPSEQARRVQAFLDLQPVSRSLTTENGWAMDSTMTLHDGTKVTYPEDLSPVVPSGSETQRAIDRSIAARHRKNRWLVGFLVGAVAGTATFIVLEKRGDHGLLPLAAPLVLAGIPGFLFYSSRADEIAERRAAFVAYPRDLGARLDVCAHELRVVPCEAYPTPAAPTAPP